MSEIENKDVQQEVVHPAEEEVVVEQQESEEPKKGSAEYNFRELRKKQEESERLIREQQQRIRELELSRVKESPEEAEEEDDLSSDDWITVKEAERRALRIVEQQLKKREAETLEDRTRMKLKDYDEVVTEENVAKLIENDQVLASTIANSPDPYSAAYKLIKKSTFYKEAKEGEKYKTETVNMQKNATKPGSVNSVSAKPLAKATSYAESDLQAVYREMTECARRR